MVCTTAKALYNSLHIVTQTGQGTQMIEDLLLDMPSFLEQILFHGMQINNLMYRARALNQNIAILLSMQ